MKRLLMIAGALIVLVIGAVAVLSLLIDPNRFRPMLESELSTALARQVRLGDLRLSFWRGSVTANDLSIADDPAYSKGQFVKARSLAIEVEIWPLIKSRQINVIGLTIDQPAITLIQAPSGEWNFSSLGGKTAPKEKPMQPAAPAHEAKLDLSVRLVRITGGSLALGSTAPRMRPLELRDVSIEVRDFSVTSQFPFTLSAKVAGGGRIALDGKAGPIDPADTAASPIEANVKIESLDLSGSRLAQTAPALAGVVTLAGSLRSDGKVARVAGKIKAEKLRLAREGTPAKKPVEFDFAAEHDRRRLSGRVTKGDIRIGAAPASLTGTYSEQPETTTVHMILEAPKMAVSELSELLPAMAVVLPRGSSLQGGTATVRLSMDGPLDRLVVAGALSLDNTKLANFDLGRKMSFIESLAGIRASNDTDIQTLGASVHYSPEGGRIEDLKLVVPAIGSMEGAGTVSPSHELLFKMRATVKTLSVPFSVQGPASDPSFRPDVKGIAREELKKAVGSETVKGLLKGILSK